MAAAPPNLKLLPMGVLALWGIGMTTVVASLMVGHWVSLPHPEPGMVLLTQLDEGETGVSEWTAYHFLYEDCPCSLRILEHVGSRPPIASITECVIVIGGESVATKRRFPAGYVVRYLTPAQVKAQYDVDATPLLVVTDKDGTIVYSGGYTPRKQGLDIQDTSIISAVIRGQKPDELPLFGCAVSKSLKALIDPIGIN